MKTVVACYIWKILFSLVERELTQTEFEFWEFEPPTNPQTGKWKLVATMKSKRSEHAVSVIKYEAELC